MNQLARYLMEHMYIDFDGSIAIYEVRQLLREADSRETRQLLSKLIEDKGIDEMMLALAEILKDYMRTGINEAVVREQLMTYGES